MANVTDGSVVWAVKTINDFLENTDIVALKSGGTGADNAADACKNLGALPLKAGKDNSLNGDLWLNGEVNSSGYKDSYDIGFRVNGEDLVRLYAHSSSQGKYGAGILKASDMTSLQTMAVDGIVASEEGVIRYASGLQIIFKLESFESGVPHSFPFPFTSRPIATCTHSGTGTEVRAVALTTLNTITIYHNWSQAIDFMYIAIGGWK